jgi:hypothetical protein
VNLEEARCLRRAGDEQAARTTYRLLWHDANAVGDDYTACIAAHMLGVSEPMPLPEKRYWHLDSLARSRGTHERWAASFLPSIYANLGYLALIQGRHEKALRYYRLAQRHMAALTNDSYSITLQEEIARRLGKPTEPPSDES